MLEETLTLAGMAGAFQGRIGDVASNDLAAADYYEYSPVEDVLLLVEDCGRQVSQLNAMIGELQAMAGSLEATTHPPARVSNKPRLDPLVGRRRSAWASPEPPAATSAQTSVLRPSRSLATGRLQGRRLTTMLSTLATEMASLFSSQKPTSVYGSNASQHSRMEECSGDFDSVRPANRLSERSFSMSVMATDLSETQRRDADGPHRAKAIDDGIVKASAGQAEQPVGKNTEHPSYTSPANGAHLPRSST
eukprot:scaffold67987_cov45-Prasinocladus_malaysianus.AAC.1